MKLAKEQAAAAARTVRIGGGALLPLSVRQAKENGSWFDLQRLVILLGLTRSLWVQHPRRSLRLPSPLRSYSGVLQQSQMLMK
jgi:hypothetical protein